MLLCLILAACNDTETFTVKFYNNGKLVGEKKVASGGDVIAPVNPIVDGYDFVGWKSGDLIVKNRRINGVKSNLTFEAVYTAKKYTLSVNFDENKGTVQGIDKTVFDYREKITLTATPKANYVFLGFSFKDTLIEKSPYSFDMPSFDVTLNAVFEGVKTKVTLDANGGFFDDEKTITTANKEVKFSDEVTFALPKKDEHTFKGYADADGNLLTDEKGFCPSWKSGEDVALYAVWEINKYTVSVSTESDKGAVAVGKVCTVSYNYGIAVSDGKPSETTSLSNPPKYNYALGTIGGKDALLVGWYLDSELSTPWDRSYVTDDVTLYAKWLADNGAAHLNVGMKNEFTFYKNQVNVYHVRFATALSTTADFTISSNAIYQMKYTLRKLDGTTLKSDRVEVRTTDTVLHFDGLTKGEVYTLEISPNLKNETKNRVLFVTQNPPSELQPKTDFDFGTTVTVTASQKGENVFDGWYDGETKVCDELVYTFVVDKNISLVARWK